MMIRLTLMFLATSLPPACGGEKGAPAPQPPAEQQAAPTAPASPKQANVAECTLETQLQAGIPGSPGHLIPSAINPNGASELADLMRRMQAELGRVRADVMAGKKVPLDFGHHRIRCAWPTSKNDRNAAFDAMAIAYLHAVDDYNSTGGAQQFNAVVQECLNCHANTCEGPIVAIRPLKIED